MEIKKHINTLLLDTIPNVVTNSIYFKISNNVSQNINNNIHLNVFVPISDFYDINITLNNIL